MTVRRTNARRTALGLAAVLGASLVLLLAPHASASAAVTDVSWWTRTPLAAPPEGGFGVGAAPDGPSTVSAITVDVGDGVETLVLVAAAAGEVAGFAAVEVCVAPAGATPSTGEALEGAPTLVCEGDSVPFGRAGDGWRADVSSLVAGASGAVTLAVVPAAGSGTVPYEAAFQPPTVQSTGSAATPPDDGGATPAPTTPAVRPGGAAPVPPPPVRLDPVAPPSPSRPIAPTAPSTSAPADPSTAATGAPGQPADEATSALELATDGLIDAEASAPRWGEAFVLVLIGLGVGAVVYGGSRIAEARA